MSDRDRCYIERSAVKNDACTSYSKVSRCDSRHDSKGGMLRALSSQTGLAQVDHPNLVRSKLSWGLGK